MYGPVDAGTDWGTIIALVTTALSLVGTAWGLWKWLDGKFVKLNEAADIRADKQSGLIAGLRAEFHEYQSTQEKENARFDKEIAVFRERMNSVPTQKDIEQILDRRMQPIITKLDTFTLELARNGVRLAQPRYEDNGN